MYILPEAIRQLEDIPTVQDANISNQVKLELFNRYKHKIMRHKKDLNTDKFVMPNRGQDQNFVLEYIIHLLTSNMKISFVTELDE